MMPPTGYRIDFTELIVNRLWQSSKEWLIPSEYVLIILMRHSRLILFSLAFILAIVTVGAFLAVTPPATRAAAGPSAPASLAATGTAADEIDLSWATSTDATAAIAGYDIYRNGTLVASATATSYVDLGLTALTSYTYTVSAFDAMGNSSPMSASASAATIAVGGTGASINESNITETLYVNAQYGNDNNAGTSAAPYATIGKALTIAAKNILGGTKIMVNPGIYRETLNLSAWSSQTNSAPLIIQAAVPGQAIISGSDVYAGWTSNGDGTYSHPWPNSWGYAALPNGWLGQQPIPAASTCPGSGAGCLALRAEMVYVNGLPLAQELSGPLTAPGTFFVTDGSSITIDPPAGTQMASAEIEVATRQSLVTADNVQNLVLRGLVFAHSASGIDGGGTVSVINGKNFLFDNDQFLWNTWEGLFMYNAADVTIQNSAANHNGDDGIVLDRVPNVFMQNDNTSFNNWRGYEAGFTGWAAAGMKTLYIHGATITSSTFSDNQTGGLWFDTDNQDILVSNTTFSENLANGADTEDNEGPLVFQNDFFCQNQSNGIDTPALEGAGGLYSRNTSYLTVESNTFDRNVIAGLLFGGSNTGRTATNYQTGVVYNLPVTSNVTMKNNLVVAVGTDADVDIPSPYNPIDPWRLSTSTLTSDDNTWYSAGNEPFIIPDGPVLNTAPTTITDTLPQWQSYTGQDTDSTSNQPSVNCSTALPPDDTTPPTTPIGLVTSTVTSSTVAFSWSPATDNVGVAGYDIYRNGTKIAITTATSYSDATVSLSASYTYTVAAYDPSGNISSQSIGLNVATPSNAPDVTPPSVPTGLAASNITTSTISLAWTQSTDPTVNGQTTSGLAGYRIYRGGVQVGTSTTNSFTNTGLTPSTTYSYTISAYDNAGNASAQSSGINATTGNPADTTPPTTSITSPLNNATVSSTITVSATASDNVGVVKVELYVDGTLTGTDTTSPYTFSLNTTSFANGSHVMFTKAYDAAGNTAVSGNITVTVNNVVLPSAPAITSSLSSSGTVGSAFSYQITGSNSPTSYNASSLPSGLSVNTSSGMISGTPTTAGTTSVTISATNAGGTGSSTLTLTVSNAPDVTPPVTSITSPLNNATVSGTSTITATASDNVGVVKVQFYMDGLLQGTDTVSPYTFSWNTNSVSNGTYTLTTKAYDAAGNVGTSGNVTVIVSNAPQTLTATLAASPVSGTAPVTTSLTASVAGTAQGTVNYIFYCNRSDTGTNITSPADLTVNAATATTYLASALCTYETQGTYAAKVIVERGSAPPAEAQEVITVSSSGTTPSSTPSSTFAITGATVSNVTDTGAELTITTNESSSIRVQYGSTTSYGNTTPASPELTTIYENLVSLTPNTVYNFLILATAEGSTSTVSSGNSMFTTAAPATAPTAPTSGGGGGGGYIPPVTSPITATSSSSSSSSIPIGGNSGSAPPPSIVYFPRPLTLGDTGADVNLLQRLLQTLGFFPTDIAPTSYFGAYTQHALLVFQNVHELAETGSLGPQSQALMNKVANAMAITTSSITRVATTTPAVSAPSSSSGLTFTRYLGPGSQGADVALLQELLIKDGDYPQAIITGYYGSLTERAVELFQAKNGIVNYGTPYFTGYGAVGPRTREALNDEEGE